MSRKRKSYRKPRLRVFNLDEAIDESKEREDWFVAFTNAVTYFEHYGYWAIKLYSARKHVKLTRKATDSLKRLSAGDIAFLLRILKLIDNEAYSNMKKIIEERNNLVHPWSKRNNLPRTEKERAIELLNQANQSIREIRSTLKLRKI